MVSSPLDPSPDAAPGASPPSAPGASPPGPYARVPGRSTITAGTAARIAQRIAEDALNASRVEVAPSDGADSTHPLAAEQRAASDARATLTAEELRAAEQSLSDAITEATRLKNQAEATRVRLVSDLARLTEERFTREATEDAARIRTATGEIIDPAVTPAEHQHRMNQLAEEIASATTLGTPTATKLLNHAITVCHDLPHTWAAFQAGALDQGRVHTIAHATLDATPVARSILDEQLAKIAPTLTPAKLVRVAEGLRNRVDPISPEARHADAFTRRGAWLDPGRNGMMELTIRSSAPELLTAMDRIDTLAKHLATLEKSEHRKLVATTTRTHENAPDNGPDRSPEALDTALAEIPLPRTFSQLRADVAVDLVSHGEIDGAHTPEAAGEPVSGFRPGRLPTSPGRGIRGQVTVTVPVRLLAGIRHELDLDPGLD
ncbi:DUF222 domain-containing protein, partial [Leucobacter sp. M11]|uniref:DUF222 domain-containing protein n=1 Tax=Leucobacter sp. M11 TaxID=2993565 RepID=UPI002D7F52BF